MNILNFEAQKVNSLGEIIEKQKEIMFAFEPNLKQRVEEFDIDIYEDQMLLKEFLLERTVEEITEAYTAFKKEHFDHYLEEIIDVFNFLIETHILLKNVIFNDSKCLVDICNIFQQYEKSPENQIQFLYGILDTTKIESLSWKCSSINAQIVYDLFSIIQEIGELTNLLKQRPWRESQYPVDLLTFKEKWLDLLTRFFAVLKIQGISFNKLSEIWSKKYQVNKFRIESNY